MKNRNTIDKNAHYLVKMHPLESCLGVIFIKSDSTEAKWVECKVVEERYKVDDNYKIELRAINTKYGKETYYQEDFMALIRSGDIIKIESK